MTLRELDQAADARLLLEWDQTSELLAVTMNCAAKKHVVSAADINPYRRRPEKLKPLTIDDAASFFGF